MEKEGIKPQITQMQNKRRNSKTKSTCKSERPKRGKKKEEALKANEELSKNTQRTAELIQKQKQDEMKAANDLYREQQKQVADSIKWVNNLGDATKKRILGENDAVKVLKEQGVTLTTLQEQELRRMQGI